MIAEPLDVKLDDMGSQGKTDSDDSCEASEGCDDVPEMSPGVRSALDSEISRLACSGLPDAAAVAAAEVSEEVVRSVENCVYPLDLSAGRPQKNVRFECCMLRRSAVADGKKTWHDCRCDDPDDFHALLRS